MALFTREQLYGRTNIPYTKKIFYEWVGSEGLVNLTHEEREGTIPLRKLFIPMTIKDPTEVEFAEYVFGDYSYWDYLERRTQSWTAKHIAEWRHLANIGRKSEAFKTIYEELKEGKSSYQAAKYLIEEPWKVAESPDKRKARKEIRETAEEAFEISGVSEDLRRLKEEGLIQ